MITIVAIGKMKDRALQSLEAEYKKRISPFQRVEILELKDEANLHTDRESEVRLVKEKEGERVLEKIRPSDFVVLLDLHGKEWTSEEFAGRFRSWQESGKNLVFVIAGSLGPSPALTERADVRWKLSSLTFTHLMTRIILLEQIYRAFMICQGRPYHK
jgi:23S rRNA (pseudouridine1915-N3)-methyltransferase